MLPSNVVDPEWAYEGQAVDVATGDAGAPSMCVGRDGGAIVIWEAESDIRAQRLLTSGTVAWPSGGLTVCAAANQQA